MNLHSPLRLHITAELAGQTLRVGLMLFSYCNAGEPIMQVSECSVCFLQLVNLKSNYIFMSHFLCKLHFILMNK